jgi:ribonuclease BN (tRNA processing enzyme)
MNKRTIRRYRVLNAALAMLALAANPSKAFAATRCPITPVTLEVLGSGGPIAEGNRAGTSYLLRIDGVPRLLIDSGAGSFLRFGEAGATLSSLDAVVITHFHADHVGDLIGILKSGSFEDRTEPLPVFGPAGNGRFLGLTAFLTRLLSVTDGAYGYLGGYLDGSEGKPRLDPTEVVTADGEGPSLVKALPHGIVLTLIPVHHGTVPAFGVLIEVGGKAIVIGGDQSRFSETFEKRLAGRKPDLLVAHHVIPEGPGQPLGLHRDPTSIGTLASIMQARRLILSHNMKRSLDHLDEGLAAIRKSYSGDVIVASDLDCFAP